MNQLSIRAGYRPLRIGWCLQNDDFDSLRKAIRLSCTLWGGSYNPVVLVDSEADTIESTISAYKLDALYGMTEDKPVTDLLKRYSHLSWPILFQDGLFDGEGRPLLVDVTNPVRTLTEELKRDNAKHLIKLPIWQDDDPISDALLMMLGAFPRRTEAPLDYLSTLERLLNTKRQPLVPSEPVDAQMFTAIKAASAYGLQPDMRSNEYHGFFFGSVKNFGDLVSYWNLQAADATLTFFDIDHSERLKPITELVIDECVAALARNGEDDHGHFLSHPAVYYESHDAPDLDWCANNESIVRCQVTAHTWSSIRAPRMQLEKQTMVAHITELGNAPRATFQLPQKPFIVNWDSRVQTCVLSVSLIGDLDRENEYTFHHLYLPRLNDFYTQNALSMDKVRVEPNGVGLVVDLGENVFEIASVNKRELVRKVFSLFKMKAISSNPGIIANRLIKQLGGLSECRIFQISGVRNLLNKYQPHQSFSSQTAIEEILERPKGQESRQPRFHLFENLGLGQGFRELKPGFVFKRLLEKQVFQVGLDIQCNSCSLEFWRSLDMVTTSLACDYCSAQVNLLPQLSDKRWRFRTSGLFARGDNQEGSVPVVLVMQQLDKLLRSYRNNFSFVTATKVEDDGAGISDCESDLLILGQGRRDEPIVVIGECKNYGSIEPDDVRKLSGIARILRNNGIKVFVLFSKLTAFSQAEVELCWQVRRESSAYLIILSKQELEQWDMYSDLSREQSPLSTRPMFLEDLAILTRYRYKPPEVNIEPGEIAALAYQFWMRDGCPDSSDLNNWLEAERVVRRRAWRMYAPPNPD